MRQAAETRRDRIVLARDAGLGRISLVSVLAGVLVAYGGFATLAALTAGLLDAVGVDTAAFSTNDWERLGVGGGIVAAAVLLVSYLFGGYVAGRMARRAGALNGLAVFAFGVLVAIAVGAAVGRLTDVDSAVDNLRTLGVPTSGSEYESIGTVAAIASLVAMLVGSVLGGALGERWHSRLIRRALDPTIGPEAAAGDEVADADRRRAAHEERRRQRELDLRGESVSVPEGDENPSVRLDAGDAETSADRHPSGAAAGRRPGATGESRRAR